MSVKGLASAGPFLYFPAGDFLSAKLGMALLDKERLLLPRRNVHRGVGPSVHPCPWPSSCVRHEVPLRDGENMERRTILVFDKLRRLCETLWRNNYEDYFEIHGSNSQCYADDSHLFLSALNGNKVSTSYCVKPSVRRVCPFDER